MFPFDFYFSLPVQVTSAKALTRTRQHQSSPNQFNAVSWNLSTDFQLSLAKSCSSQILNIYVGEMMELIFSTRQHCCLEFCGSVRILKTTFTILYETVATSVGALPAMTCGAPISLTESPKSAAGARAEPGRQQYRSTCRRNTEGQVKVMGSCRHCSWRWPPPHVLLPGHIWQRRPQLWPLGIGRWLADVQQDGVQHEIPSEFWGRLLWLQVKSKVYCQLVSQPWMFS